MIYNKMIYNGNQKLSHRKISQLEKVSKKICRRLLINDNGDINKKKETKSNRSIDYTFERKFHCIGHLPSFEYIYIYILYLYNTIFKINLYFKIK